MTSSPHLIAAAKHTARARAIMDEFEGKRMPAEAALAIDGHLKAAKNLRKDHDRGQDLTEIENYLSEPQHKHDMHGDTSKSYTGDGTASYGEEDESVKNADRLTKDQSFTGWMESKGLCKAEDRDLDLGRYLRGLATGEWSGAEREQSLYTKALSEGTLTAGGHLVPTPLAAGIIDLARNASRVMQAGAVTVPMQAQTLKVPRLTGEGSPGWRAENAAITDSDMTFDAVTFTARSLNRLVRLSVELFEDSDPSAGGVIARSFAAQFALEIDRAALRGTGTAPEPRGVLNTTGVTTTTHGANGALLTNYDFHLDAVGVVRGNNFEPNAHLQAPRTNTSLSKLKESTTLAYLAPPAGMLPMLPTKQVPIDLTVGTSTDCSEIYTGDWSQLMVGIRSQIRLEFLRERYADSGQYAFLAWFRGDVQLAQPSAFVVDTGVRT